MSEPPTDIHLAAAELRLATFVLARRLRCVRADDAMSDAQLAVLAALHCHGRSTISELAVKERVTAPSMTSLINGLEEQKLVLRTPDSLDRRRVQVEITAAGVAIVTQTIQRCTNRLAGMLDDAGFTPDELDTLRRASIIMRRAAEQ